MVLQTKYDVKNIVWYINGENSIIQGEIVSTYILINSAKNIDITYSISTIDAVITGCQENYVFESKKEAIKQLEKDLNKNRKIITYKKIKKKD